MKTQRGAMLLDIVELIAIGALATAVIAGVVHTVHKFEDWIGVPYAEKQRAADEKVHAVTVQQLAAAVAANQKLDIDVNGPGGWSAQVIDCNVRARKAQSDAEQARARAHTLEQAMASSKARSKAGEQAQQDRLNKPIVAQDCPTGLSGIGQNIIKIGKDQLLDTQQPSATIKIK